MQFFSVGHFRAALAASLLVCGCSRGDSAPASAQDTMAADPPRPTLIAPVSQPYRVVALGSPGAITGTVDFSGVIPASLDSAVIDPSCGRAPASPVSHSGTRIGGVVVWITDIRAGKPLPGVRRFELANDHCALDPHVQVILANSTLNVTSEDRVLHLNRFIDVGTGRTLALAPFNDEGEVIPLDHSFTAPGEIEVVCDLHPASHAWLAVLDHPYFTMTSAAGAFTIEGIPAGRYHVRAWHPSFGVADDSVTVVAGQPVNVAMRLIPQSAERNLPRRPARPMPGSGFSAPQPSVGADSSAVDSAVVDSSGQQPKTAN